MAGCRVLDFTVNAAGPYAAWLLGALGADVIKVESVTRSDPVRGIVDRPYLHSNSFEDTNSGKRSIAIDLKHDAGRRAALDLASRCDIVVSSFRPGVMDRLGVSTDAIHAANPAVVVGCLSATGALGPYAGLPGYAGIFNALGGLGGLTGYDDGPPTELRTSVDMRTGAMFAMILVAALSEARTTGRGRLVDFSASECVALLSGEHLTAATLGSDDFEPRLGNRDELWSPQGTFRAADGEAIHVCIRDDVEWARLVELTEADGIDVDPTLTDSERRRVDPTGAERVVEAWIARRDSTVAERTLIAAGIPATVVLGAAEVASDPHLVARGYYFQTPELREHQPLDYDNLIDVAHAPWTIDGRRGQVGEAPPLGAHSVAVLTEVLGIDPERARALAHELDPSAASVGGAP